jgi:tetratricopeptide (TPR) repeat protein
VTELSSKLNDIVEAHRLLAISHGELGDFSSFISDLDWLIDHDFADEGIYDWRAGFHDREGNYPQAILDFTKALELNPNSPQILVRRSQTYHKMQHYDLAEQDLSQIVGMGNQHPNFLKFVYDLRGLARYEMGKTQDALDDFNEVMRLRGDTPVEDVSEYLTLNRDMSWIYS